MHPKYQISDSLPLQFSNGSRIQRFSKKCPHCGELVNAREMHGRMVMIQDRILLAAEASCLRCRGRFSVACVITPEKRVLKVMLPLWLYSAYIGFVSRRLPPQPAAVTAIVNESSPPDHQPAELMDIEAREDLLGHYQEEPIYALLHRGPITYDFDRICPDPQNEKLGRDEYLVKSCLVYRRRVIPA